MAIRIRTWRWLAKILQATVVLGIPFLKINGESALRFDVPALTLHLFGARVAMDEFFLVLVAILFLTFLVITVTVLFGRIWCGWICPQTVVTEITGFLDSRSDQRSIVSLRSLFFLIPISALLGASMIWYFVSPYEFVDRLMSHSLGRTIGAIWALATIVTFVNFAFIRRTFCATICPYAKMQGMLFDEQTLIIAMDPERKRECMGCEACVSACPVGIDVRSGLQSDCVNCAACIDACADKMVLRKHDSLIGYRFGTLGARLVFWRKGVVFSAAGIVVFFALLAYLVVSRPRMEMVVIPDSRSMPRITSDQHIINMFALTITNRSDVEQKLVITADGVLGNGIVNPDHVQVQKNGQVRITIAVMVPEGAVKRYAGNQMNIRVASRSDPQLSVSQAITLQHPR